MRTTTATPLLIALFAATASAQQSAPESLSSPAAQARVAEAVRGLADPAAAQPNNITHCSDSEVVSVGQFTREGMPLAEAIASAVKEMAANQGKMKYANSVSKQSFNPDYWRPTGQAGTYELRLVGDDGKEISPSEAIQDIVHNPGKYKIECGTATKFLYYLAFIKNIGSTRFDRAVRDRRNAQFQGGLYIGPGEYESLLREVMKRETSSRAGPLQFPGMATEDIVKILQPGDAIYMLNLKPVSGASSIGLGGENMVFSGDSKFYAHRNSQALRSDNETSSSPIVTAETVQTMLRYYWDPSPGPATAPGAAKAGVENQEPWFVDEYFHPQQAVLDKLGLPKATHAKKAVGTSQ